MHYTLFLTTTVTQQYLLPQWMQNESPRFAQPSNQSLTKPAISIGHRNVVVGVECVGGPVDIASGPVHRQVLHLAGLLQQSLGLPRAVEESTSDSCAEEEIRMYSPVMYSLNVHMYMYMYMYVLYSHDTCTCILQSFYVSQH